MSRGPDAGTLLERAIVAHAARNGVAITVTEAAWDRWASATFAGARHALTLQARPGDALDAWLAALPEAELPVRRTLVADLTIAAVRRGDPVSVAIEVLTVDE
ncbi:hypothetical protein [Sphingomonas immobilis]|uniref:Uncharacterized protein n=1 Tax=Sphingomonas immobilis TaxID=3063997 RepID=A0ABT9A2Y4_9SPHN|nr:hypothetical protein [Sphingomonas sp. CA1-15]MDO7843351.1 hypothetical protein [Sphingomonas sp. CA1-15]